MCECPGEKEEAGARGLVASWWMLCEKPLCTMVTSRVEGKSCTKLKTEICARKLLKLVTFLCFTQ